MNEKRDCNKTATAALAGNPSVGHDGVYHSVFSDALALLNNDYHYKKETASLNWTALAFALPTALGLVSCFQ